MYDCYFCPKEIPKLSEGCIIYCDDTWHYGCLECARIASKLGHPIEFQEEE